MNFRMGDIADMMIDGTLCEGCGVYIEGSGAGFPRRCGACKTDSRANTQPRHSTPSNRAKVACKVCGRHVKAVGLDQHMRDKHGGPKSFAQQLSELEHEEQP
jgi:Zn finger protein HypA/HybF involved in hydrogenase expression